ncbi:MAG: hypothetical protein HUU21_20810 [Polyangiaceae bacterium]|nr:hypothetical protein [Polyangiaceae bacterium]
MLGRLLIGLVKGLLIGGLLGFGLAKLGLGAPIALVAYPAAALAGILVGLVAGKPIWAKDAKIEAGMKAFVGAILGAGLMFAARRWLTMEVTLPLQGLVEAKAMSGALGTLALTSLAMITALLGGFYEADNNPDEGEGGASTGKRVATEGPRAEASEDLGEEELSAEAEPKRAKK